MSTTIVHRLNQANENTWLQVGILAEKQGDLDRAMMAFSRVIHFNPVNAKALIQLASICRRREQFTKAVEFLQIILTLESENGEVWGALGHCFLMLDDLRKAFDAYQEALVRLPNPRDPSLWYGIGLLYDRFGCPEQAEGAFAGVLKMDPQFEKRDDIFFQLGVISKQQLKLQAALECFNAIVNNPPRPLTSGDVWYQIGHTHELLKDFDAARKAYEKVLKDTPNSPKVLHRLGWLYHTCGTPEEQETGHNHLVQSIQLDHTDGVAWYLLGRIYMSQQKYRRSYDAFQQAIYRDPNNPVFWCSIGVLYYLMNQHRDALHAYIRAIRLNQNLGEGWFNLGLLYEMCDQPQDAVGAYRMAEKLEAGTGLNERLEHVKLMLQGNAPTVNGQPPGASIKPILPDPASPARPRSVSLPNLVVTHHAAIADIPSLPCTPRPPPGPMGLSSQNVGMGMTAQRMNGMQFS